MKSASKVKKPSAAGPAPAPLQFLTTASKPLFPTQTEEVPPFRDDALYDTRSTLGHNFGEVALTAPVAHESSSWSRLKDGTCPLSLSSPRACPFGGACHTCPLPVQTKLSISEPGDEYEQEADRVAEAVMRDDPAPHLPAKGKEPPHLQRLRREQPPTEEKKQENTEEMVEKVAETFLDETEIGKHLKEQIETWGEDFLATLHGQGFTGVTAAGVISILAANHLELPMQVPEITLMPGLKVKFEWKGPMDQPTDGSITFSYSPEPDVGKPGLSEKERYQARMVAKQDARLEAASRESQVTPEERASGQELADRQFAAEMAARRAPQFREGGALEQGQKKSKFQLTEPSFTSPFKGFETPKIPGLELKLKPPGKLPKRKEETVQRKAQGNNPPVREVPPIVHEVLQSPGQPLESGARTFMENRFGYDFSQVRVHTGSLAAEAAHSIDAQAFTYDRDIIFGEGQYIPKISTGQKLLGHELAHVVQQSGAKRLPLPHQLFPSLQDAQGVKAIARQSATSTAITPENQEIMHYDRSEFENRFDAEIIKSHGVRIVKLIVNLAFEIGPWPRFLKPSNEILRFKESLKRVVENAWSCKYGLLNEYTGEIFDAEVEVTFGNENPHATVLFVPETEGSGWSPQEKKMRLEDTSVSPQEYVRERVFSENGVAIKKRVAFSQIPAVHEFGHLLGLEHIRCPGNEAQCYGLTEKEIGDVMGAGSVISPRDYEPFLQIMYRYGNDTIPDDDNKWKLIPQT